MKIGNCPECNKIKYLVILDGKEYYEGICTSCAIKTDKADREEAEDREIQSRIARERDETKNKKF